MKKIVKLILIIFFIAVIFCACFRIDKPENQKVATNTTVLNENGTKSDYKQPRTELINGVEYKMSRSPIGEYGGL